MQYQTKILNELKELKSIMAKLIGTADLPASDRFSAEALNIAAKEFQKLSVERGEWIADGDIDKIIKKAPWRAGAFFIHEFGFCNYFKRGHTSYFYKRDLVSLGKQLKERNVDLSRYMELKEDQAKFKKYVATVNQGKGGKKNKNPYQFPDNLKDIQSEPAKRPSPDLVREDLKNLKEEFFQHKLSEYIDIYHGNYAMMKFIYHFDKYIDPQIKKRCRKWCENFNYANHALAEITKKKEVFIPVQEADMIRL